MKLTIAFTLAMLLPAGAQVIEISKTVPLVNKDTKEVVGSVTISGNHVYLRAKDGKHIATVEYHGDGTRTAYDDSGKVIDMPMEAK